MVVRYSTDDRMFMKNIDLTEFEKNDWNHLHDCIYHVTGKKSTQQELEKLFLLIPEDLQLDAVECGMNDTLWRENFIKWCEIQLT